jgi:hypothetical protein
LQSEATPRFCVVSRISVRVSNGLPAQRRSLQTVQVRLSAGRSICHVPWSKLTHHADNCLAVLGCRRQVGSAERLLASTHDLMRVRVPATDPPGSHSLPVRSTASQAGRSSPDRGTGPCYPAGGPCGTWTPLGPRGCTSTCCSSARRSSSRRTR